MDHLIPSEILEICGFDRIDLRLDLSGQSCQAQWPCIDVVVDGQLRASTHADPKLCWQDLWTTQRDSLHVKICYHGKTHDHTRVDDQGNIVENQCVTIDRLCVNGVDLVSTGLIYRFGEYRMELADDKLQYYQQHGFDTGPSHSLTMWENGTWEIEIPVPVLPAMIRYQSRYQPHEKWMDEDIYQQVHRCVLDIQELERKIKEKQRCKY